MHPGSALRRLLSPQLDACLACGRSAKLGAALPLLCERCSARVPWIVEPRCPVCGRAQGCPDCLRTGAESRAFALNRSAVLYDTAMREWIAEYKYGGREQFAEPFSIMLEQAYRRMRRELSVHGESLNGYAAAADVHIEKSSSIYRNGTERNDRLRLLPDPSRLLITSSMWSADCVTWVPVSAERLEERGFNQAELMARRFAKRLKLPACELLDRTVHTGKQSFKTRAQRLHNLDGAFRLLPNLDPRFFKQWDLIGNRKRPGGSFPIRILLIDDIYTTGTTASVCASALKPLEIVLQRPLLIYSLTLARS